MLFHEIYSTYFQTVAKILAEAVEHPLTTEEINAIIQDYAFEESILNIPKSLGMAHWQLLKEDGTTILRKNPTMPLTILQKRWINAIALDPRIRLFTDQPVVFSDVEPLFLPEDIYVFDKYSDGDPYENPEYIQNFRLILDAIKHQYPIQISITNRHGKRITTRTIPEYLEYSEKDDKFRLIGTGSKLGNTINLGRITSCEKCENQQGGKVGKRNQPRPRKVIFELIDERNALERVLMHFAHLEKQVEKIDERKYQVTLYYDKEDETEILIRVLSFGPMLHVVKPVAFNHDDVSDYRYQQLFTEICDYKEIYDSVGKEKYGLVLSHYPFFSWKNMGRGKILLYGHTHESEEDRFYQNCLRQMQENDCRHVYDKKLWACNVGCMLPYMNYTPRTLAEILAGVEAET